MKPDRYDTIVIGAGHNGLVCAAYLAQHGQRVLVLETSDRPGGLGATREFHPGFQASVAHSIGHFSKTIVSLPCGAGRSVTPGKTFSRQRQKARAAAW